MSRRKIRTPGVYHDKNGTYYLKYKNKTYRGFKTVEEAEIKKAQLMLHAGEHDSRLTFRDVALDFLSSEKERVRNEEIKFGTYQKKEQLFRNYINDELSKKKMDDLSLLKLRSFRNGIGALDLSTRQKNYILQITKQIILHGVRYFDVKTDNTIELAYFKKSREESRNNLRDLRNVINDEEFKIFISHVKEVDYHYLFVMLYLTGMRLGEALALQWKDFDSDHLSIHATLTNKTENVGSELIETKTVSSERTIKIAKSLSEELKLLKEYKKTYYGFNDNWFILGYSSPLSTTTVDRKKNEAINLSGVKYFTNHQLRHSFVTNAFNRGEQLTSIGEYVGHKNISETMRTYAHLTIENSVKFDNYIDNSSQNLLTRDLNIRKPTV